MREQHLILHSVFTLPSVFCVLSFGMITTIAPPRESTFHAVRRRLAALAPGEAPLVAASPLELVSRGVLDAPTVRPADVIEPGGMRAHGMQRATSPGFAAFLDGAQWSLVAAWIGGVPVVHGTIAAVVRQRRERRLTTWGAPIVRRALYAPLDLLPMSTRDALRDEDLELVDTLERRKPDSPHPFTLQEIAYQCVLAARESAEQELAKQWCAMSTDALFVDGGIAGNDTVATSDLAVGVVKSHQTLYGDPDDLRTVMGLAAGERTSIARVAVSNRRPVASWYLRLRDPVGHDPFWGLVRVEVALSADMRSLVKHADRVSGWVLAEALPLSVPDVRWDRMVYGIRDCEEYLRAIQ
jgi:hypothetical protein